MKTFEKYIESRWEPECVLDDDMPDAFDSMLGELDGQEYIDFADEYMENTLKQLKEIVQKYTDPKPEFSGITWDMIIAKVK
jgi:hypothetical protein